MTSFYGGWAGGGNGTHIAGALAFGCVDGGRTGERANGAVRKVCTGGSFVGN